MWCARNALKCQSRLLTKQDLAAALQVTPRTISKWVHAGWIPAPIYVAPQAPRWCPCEFERWKRKQKRRKRPPA